MFYVCSSECGPVGVEDRNTIPDARMTASTFHINSHNPYYGRLNGNRGNGAWCAKTTSDRTDYLQVDMGAVRSVCALVIQGHGKVSAWTTSYKVHLSTDGATWKVYKGNNVEKVTKFNKFMFSCLVAEIYSKLIFFFPKLKCSYRM